MKYNFNILSGLYMNGEWRKDGTHQMEVHHKSTGEILAEVVVASKEQVQEAVDIAARTYRQNPLTAYERYKILLRASQLIEGDKDDISLILSREGGKPIKDAKAEVERAIQTLILSAEEAKRIHGQGLPLDAMPGMENRVGLTIRVPVGVIAAISPFNYPLNLVAHKVAPALAGGNAVVLKPASTTPLSAILLCHILQEAGLPKGYLNLVIGSGSTVGDALVKANGIQMITFTGSPEVGESIKSKSRLSKVTLELGNNSPNIVHYDADIEKAVNLLTMKAFQQSGQSCISVQRIYVHRKIFDTFVEKIKNLTNGLKVGNTDDSQSDIGPLISEEEALRVEQWISEAVKDGAKLLCGGKRNGAFIEPTLLVNVKPDMKVVCSEIFGPVASIVPYQSLDDAIKQSNDSDYGLQAGLFTNDVNTAWYAAQRLEYGGVIVNDASSFRADLMPYGGVKNSGIGREGPSYAIEEMTELRNVIFNMD